MRSNAKATDPLDALLQQLGRSADPLVRDWATWLQAGERSAEGKRSDPSIDGTAARRKAVAK
jgi:hypothetical protein